MDLLLVWEFVFDQVLNAESGAQHIPFQIYFTTISVRKHCRVQKSFYPLVNFWKDRTREKLHMSFMTHNFTQTSFFFHHTWYKGEKQENKDKQDHNKHEYSATCEGNRRAQALNGEDRWSARSANVCALHVFFFSFFFQTGKVKLEKCRQIETPSSPRSRGGPNEERIEEPLWNKDQHNRQHEEASSVQGLFKELVEGVSSTSF